MQVHLKLDNSEQNNDVQVLTAIENIVSNAAALINLSVDAIGDIWITNEEWYGKIIGDLAGEDSYTNNAVFIGVGKTIARKSDTGQVISHLVLRDYIIVPYLNAILDGGRNAQPNVIEGHLLLFHELGHCKDYFLRVDQFDDLDSSSPVFRIEKRAIYNIPILASEFAACFHAAVSIKPPFLEIERDRTFDTISKLIDELQTLRKNCLMGSENPIKLANTAPEYFWVILIQYAKLVATRHGNSENDPVMLGIWPNCPPEVELIFQNYSQDLIGIWNNYPNWSFQQFGFAQVTWHKLSAAFQFTYRKGVDSDGVWWV